MNKPPSPTATSPPGGPEPDAEARLRLPPRPPRNRQPRRPRSHPRHRRPAAIPSVTRGRAARPVNTAATTTMASRVLPETARRSPARTTTAGAGNRPDQPRSRLVTLAVRLRAGGRRGTRQAAGRLGQLAPRRTKRLQSSRGAKDRGFPPTLARGAEEHHARRRTRPSSRPAGRSQERSGKCT